MPGIMPLNSVMILTFHLAVYTISSLSTLFQVGPIKVVIGTHADDGVETQLSLELAKGPVAVLFNNF